MVIVPALAFQVTVVLLVPVTEAVNCWLAPTCRVLDEGERVMPTDAGGVIAVTCAEPDLLLSAMLVAVTVYVPALCGAVYRPLLLIVPALAFQLTVVLLVPVTEAVNCWVAPVHTPALLGETATDTLGVGVGPPAALRLR